MQSLARGGVGGGGGGEGWSITDFQIQMHKRGTLSSEQS